MSMPRPYNSSWMETSPPQNYNTILARDSHRFSEIPGNGCVCLCKGGILTRHALKVRTLHSKGAVKTGLLWYWLCKFANSLASNVCREISFDISDIPGSSWAHTSMVVVRIKRDRVQEIFMA